MCWRTRRLPGSDCCCYAVCASPAYLARHGTPQRPEDLLAHNCLYVSTMPELRRWPFRCGESVELLEVSGTVGSDSAEALLQLAE